MSNIHSSINPLKREKDKPEPLHEVRICGAGQEERKTK